MSHPTHKATEAETIAHEHLVHVLLEQIERTFETGGRGEGLRRVGMMLRLLDSSALRGLVYAQGLQDESELAESENEPRDTENTAP